MQFVKKKESGLKIHQHGFEPTFIPSDQEEANLEQKYTIDSPHLATASDSEHSPL